MLTELSFGAFVGWRGLVQDPQGYSKAGQEDETEMDIKGFVFSHLRRFRYVMCRTFVATD